MTSSETEAAPASDLAGHGQRIGDWFTAGRFAALLGLLIALTFSEVVTGQATFFYRDFGVYTYPVAFYQRECFWRGEFPLWNPLSNCGIPFLAQWNTSALYPPTLFYLVLPLSWSLGIFQLGHLFLSGVGMYFLARRWTGNPLAASVAGAMFAFNGLSWQMLDWVSNLAAWAWMPWVVLAVERAWRRREGRSLGLAALAGGMQMLTGSPEIIFLTWCLLGLLWLTEFVRGETSRLSVLWRTLGVGLLVGGLAAAQLLPFLDLLRHSSRDVNFSDLGWAMPLTGPANFLVPLLRCFPSGHGVYPQADQYWTPSYYAGVGTVALALVAIWRIRDRRVWVLAAALVLSVVMALGPQGYLYSGVKLVLPQLGFMRYPIKFVVLAVFALPLLAAYGINWVTQAVSGSNDSKIKDDGTPHPGPLPSEVRGRMNSSLVGRSLWVVLATLLGLIALIVVVDRIYPKPWENWTMIWHNALGRAVFLLLILGLLAVLRGEQEFRRRLLLAFSVVLLFWADIYTHAPKINPTLARSVYMPGFSRAQMKLAPSPQMGEPRAMPTLPAVDLATKIFLPEPVAEYTCRRLALYANCNLLDGVPKTDGFFSSYLREPHQILTLLGEFDAKGSELKGFKDFLGIAYISVPVTNAGGLDWTNRDSFQPLIAAGQKPIFADGTDIGTGLFSAEFDPRHTVYLPTAAKAYIAATNEVEAKVVPVRLSAQRLEFETEATAQAMVTVAQTFYHPWRAYVDGRETPLWPANYAFQALEVPAGRHRVSVVYEDKAFLLGAVLSAVCFLGCGLLLLWRGAKEDKI